MRKLIKKLEPHLIQITENTYLITAPTGNTIAKLTINSDNTITIEDYTNKLNELEYALNQQFLRKIKQLITNEHLNLLCYKYLDLDMQ